MPSDRRRLTRGVATNSTFAQALMLLVAAGCAGGSAAPDSSSGGVVTAGGFSAGGTAIGGERASFGGSSGNGPRGSGGATKSSTNGSSTGSVTGSGGSRTSYAETTGGSTSPSGIGGAVSMGGTSSNAGAGGGSGGRIGGGASSVGGGRIGSNANGGDKASGGAPTGGALATGGATAGGASASGGAASSGVPATGGAVTGGTSATGGSSDDRCALGIYDANSPPKVLTLSGALGTHDPSAVESDGTYYLFATGLGAKTSNNLTTWTDVARPFSAPAWAQTAVPGVTDLWAADISYFGGKYHLYYSASTFGSNRSCIGHATKTSLRDGSWNDQGSATICSNVNSTDDWNAIDPGVVLDDAGTPWMAFGSFWSGIKIIQLDSSGARVGNTVTAIAARPKNSGALEGPYIVRRCGYFYLFTSWDTCCKGASSTYNIRVGRSTGVTGPYADKAGTALLQGGGTLIAQTGGSWVGPGGQSVMISGNKAYLVYHAYASSNGNATLRIAELVWDDSGWPVAVGP